MSELHLPQGYNLRPLEKEDFDRGYLQTLETLTSVGDVDQEHFNDIVDYWKSQPKTYKNLVITDYESQVVAVGSLIVETKLIHSCAKVGHIEDIAVRPDQQGKKLGLYLIRQLIELAKEEGCYKAILDCDPKNEGFYVKCGMSRAGLEMEYRF
ncbi:uncharacterized protein OGAPODRAFT_91830 [Ogataea polymorpha]|uniref:Glucosamine 6-phosphate N-acetyltransferase n=1 Tax=Ogataea polymorpha TaxID=460523 RepID=A0A1B7SPC8_9ASCO|nr:uncharacterized protein OGAPODRAFT_91830 [Ogataea polymorpha]KAH3660847.1 hypothetical protein OGATHE_005179 [Ogataea polymorpha]OBA18336.1 hypothetical protein OGAPODRAFT_91830 [Ogataea polymorpha]